LGPPLASFSLFLSLSLFLSHATERECVCVNECVCEREGRGGNLGPAVGLSLSFSLSLSLSLSFSLSLQRVCLFERVCVRERGAGATLGPPLARERGERARERERVCVRERHSVKKSVYVVREGREGNLGPAVGLARIDQRPPPANPHHPVQHPQSYQQVTSPLVDLPTFLGYETFGVPAHLITCHCLQHLHPSLAYRGVSLVIKSPYT